MSRNKNKSQAYSAFASKSDAMTFAEQHRLTSYADIARHLSEKYGKRISANRVKQIAARAHSKLAPQLASLLADIS